MKLTQKQVQHLLWRAGLFDQYHNIQLYENQDVTIVWKELQKASEQFKPIKVADQNQINFQAVRMMSKEEKKNLMKQSRELTKELNKKWLDEMIQTNAVIRERMSLFWHNHFACTSKNVFFLQSYLNTIRKHALGNFRDMLFAASKEPAMLQYLNNQQNRKRKPNENFAREVMELFTIGRGNYTEEDVKNAARAFTGWSFTQEGKFILRSRQHDEGSKTIFDKTANYSGEEVLEILLSKKETALRVVGKLYRYLVNDRVDEEKVTELANYFYDENYDISKLLTRIFTADWFYEEANIGAKIKSPVDLLIGVCRSMGVTFDNADGPLFIQKHLGQMLLKPPNVAGWPGGKDWIDSSTLIFRTRLVEMVLLASEVEIRQKSSGDVNDQFKLGRLKKLGANVNVSNTFQYLVGMGYEDRDQQYGQYMLQTHIPEFAGGENIQNPMLRSLVRICRSPEYQMC